jgi:hypothetical protein
MEAFLFFALFEGGASPDAGPGEKYAARLLQ